MMKKLLFILTFLLSTSLAFAQVVAEQVDDFEDGTTQNWFEGSATAPVNMVTDGPGGAGDNYLRDTATGTSGPGGRMVIRNLTQWNGNYTTEGIVAIKMDVRAITSDLTIRVATSGPGGKFCSTTGVLVTAGSGWTQVVIPFTAADLTSVSDGSAGGPPGFDAAATLAAANRLRILSALVPSFIGDFINGEMHLDNITASTTLSTPNIESQEAFSVYPNPGKSTMNVALNSSSQSGLLEVYDVLGKRVHVQDLNQLNNRITVSNWNSGMYLVKVTTENGSQTKRFVKQ